MMKSSCRLFVSFVILAFLAFLLPLRADAGTLGSSNPDCGAPGQAQCHVCTEIAGICLLGTVVPVSPEQCGAFTQKACRKWQACVHYVWPFPCVGDWVLAQPNNGCDLVTAPGRVRNYFGTCGGCGANWNPPCDSAPRCDLWHTDAGFNCIPCGGAGQAICLSFPNCKKYHRVHLGFCEFTGYADEPTTNNTIDEVPKQTADEVWGWADLHEHMFANEAYGGAVLWGKPFDQGGINKALARCDYTWDPDFKTVAPIYLTDANWPVQASSLLAQIDGRGYPVHGSNWVEPLALLPPQYYFGLTVNISTETIATFPGLHHTAGLDDFPRGSDTNHGWPHYLDGGHQQMYYKWVKRAYEGGLRLLLDMPVNNEILCKLSMRREGYVCNDMDVIKLQIEQMHALEDFIDLEDGGEKGSGWYRIAYSPQQAREIIEDGAMAVVIGMEIDSLFGCKPGKPECNDEVWLSKKINKYWNMGVRHLFPVHLFDNAFSGTALYSDIMETANLLSTYRDIDSHPCPEEVQGGPDGTPVPAGYTHQCNSRGLTEEGEKLLKALMKRGMLIDIDHFSHRALEGYIDPETDEWHKGVFEILQEGRDGDSSRPYPPLSSHSVITPNGVIGSIKAGAGTEYGHTEARVKRIMKMGGMVTVNPPRRHGEWVAEGDQPGTSRQFVEGQDTHDGVSFGYKDIVRLAKEVYEAEDAEDWMDPNYLPIALTGDHGAFNNQPGPRFKEDGITHLYASDKYPPLDYGENGFDSFETDSEGELTGKFNRQVTGSRTYDFNIDGLAHYGLVPDMLADIRNILDTDREEDAATPDLQPIFNSAEAFLRMWTVAYGDNPDDPDICADDDSGQVDTDGDGLSDACDSDDDNDGVDDAADNCPLNPNNDQYDLDGDGAGDICDQDDDNDLVNDADDNCPVAANTDQSDVDDDGVGDSCDNCPGTANSNQADMDNDGRGDACDSCPLDAENDIDGDGICGDVDICPLIADTDQLDDDIDGLGNACDNCPSHSNPEQEDGDADGIGNTCDNCVDVANIDQLDFDLDGVGDLCDPDVDGDGVANDIDTCAFTLSGEVVEPGVGCSIEQLVTCEGPMGATESWPNHGKYVSMVTKTAVRFMKQGLITGAEKGVVVAEAAESACGAKK